MAQDDATSAWILAALDRHETGLLAYATRILGGDVERARDAVQETFLSLCRQKHAQVEERLAEWLFTVCRNKARDAMRKEGPMRGTSEAEAVDRASPDPEPAMVAERGDAISHVLGLLERLPANQREVLRLKFRHGLSYKEIGRVTDLTVGNVGFLIHVGLKALRERLGGDFLAQSMEGSAQ